MDTHDNRDAQNDDPLKAVYADLLHRLGALQAELLRGEPLDATSTAGNIQFALARLLYALLNLTPQAQNHITVDLPPPNGGSGDRWSLTLQREGALTPAQRILAQEARIADLETQLSAVGLSGAVEKQP